MHRPKYLGLAVLLSLSVFAVAIPATWAFDATEQITLTVEPSSVQVGEPVTIRVFAKAIDTEHVLYMQSGVPQGSFGSLYISGPLGLLGCGQGRGYEVCGQDSFPLDIIPFIDNPVLRKARVHCQGPSYKLYCDMSLVKGDNVCILTKQQTFATPGTYTILWKDGRGIDEYPPFQIQTDAVKTLTVVVVKSQTKRSRLEERHAATSQ